MSIFQIIGVVGAAIGIVGWLFNLPFLYVLGGLLCLVMIGVRLFTGDLKPYGRVVTFVILIVGAFLASPWYEGFLGAAIVATVINLFSIGTLQEKQREVVSLDLESIGIWIAIEFEQFANETIPYLMELVKEMEQRLEAKTERRDEHNVMVELLCLYVHLFDRNMSHKLSAEDRQRLMDSIVQNLAENYEVETKYDAMRFISHYNEAEIAYGTCTTIWDEDNPKQSLQWVIGKRLANSVGHPMDIAFIDACTRYLVELLPTIKEFYNLFTNEVMKATFEKR
jgi:hypothetical protein